MMAQQAMGPAFFYYSPDPNPENRHHGHFIPHPQPQSHHAHPYAPHSMPQQMQMFPQVPVLPSTPLPSTPGFSRPSSSCSQPPMHTQGKHSFTSAPQQQVLTPQASPVRVHQALHRPTIVLDTVKFDESEGMCYPQTPPLSAAGSVMGSPGSCDMLATPLNPMFSGLEGTPMGIKEEVDILPVEQFPMLEWNTCSSPPMTPSKSKAPSQHILSCVRQASPTADIGPNCMGMTMALFCETPAQSRLVAFEQKDSRNEKNRSIAQRSQKEKNAAAYNCFSRFLLLSSRWCISIAKKNSADRRFPPQCTCPSSPHTRDRLRHRVRLKLRHRPPSPNTAHPHPRLLQRATSPTSPSRALPSRARLSPPAPLHMPLQSRALTFAILAT